MAALTFTKTPRQIMNPFDGSLDNVLDVNALLDDVLLEQYSVQFPDPTPDATIQAYLVTDLSAKGYVIT
jgi:hypothetical protein